MFFFFFSGRFTVSARMLPVVVLLSQLSIDAFKRKQCVVHLCVSAEGYMFGILKARRAT